MQGLNYIHLSSFGSHGFLSSINCLVDSYWTVKISDYGMAEFRQRRAAIIKSFSQQTGEKWFVFIVVNIIKCSLGIL